MIVCSKYFTALFCEDYEKVTDPCFSLSIYLVPIFLTIINCLAHPLKQKSIISNKTFINLSKHDIYVAL